MVSTIELWLSSSFTCSVSNMYLTLENREYSYNIRNVNLQKYKSKPNRSI